MPKIIPFFRQVSKYSEENQGFTITISGRTMESRYKETQAENTNYQQGFTLILNASRWPIPEETLKLTNCVISKNSTILK